MVITDADRRILFDWLDEITVEIVRLEYRDIFSRICHILMDKCLQLIELDRKTYQLYALGCLYISSCFASEYPLSLSYMRSICVECYARSDIIDATHNMIRRVFCDEPKDVVVMVRTVYSEVNTTCDLVQIGSDTMYIRKKITHHENLLPNYSAVCELCTYMIIAPDGNDHVCNLKYIHVERGACYLYYPYYPCKFESFKVHVNSNLRTYATQIARGISSLHSMDIAHRDLKPDNLRVTNNGDVYIIDFGACGFGKNRSTIPICTMTHRSPEILVQEMNGTEHMYSGKALDMWSFGIILAELVLGCTLFGRIYDSTSPEELLSRIRHNIVSLRSLLTCEPIITEIIIGCLQMDPNVRLCIDDVLKLLTSS